jgi:hypothetical protein
MSKPVPLCSHVMTRGKTCGVPASRGSRYCYHHDPDRRERKPLRGFAASIESLDSISAMHYLIMQSIRELLQGKLDARRARALVSSARDAIAIYESQLRGLTVLCGAVFEQINRTRNL